MKIFLPRLTNQTATLHPAVLNTYFTGAMIETVKHRVEEEITDLPHELRHEEVALLHLLQKRLSQAAA
jgi:DNA topoisomerase-1